jgi:hypothetical protein
MVFSVKASPYHRAQRHEQPVRFRYNRAQRHEQPVRFRYNRAS